MIKIAIADDHQMMLSCLQQLFSEEEDISVTGIASTYSQIQTIYKTAEWDIFILDIMMPVKNGFEVFSEVMETKPEAKVLFLSNLKDDEIIAKAKNSGAYGFLNKIDAAAELITAIRCINNGGKYFNSNTS